MAVYRVQGPDGAIHRFEGPDNATPEQVTAFASQQFGAARPQSQADRDAIAAADVAAVPKRIGELFYGAGKGAADLVQGYGQAIINGAAKLSGDGPAGKYVKQKAAQFNDYLSQQEAQYQADTPGSGAAGLGRATASVGPFLFGGEGQALNSLAKAPMLIRMGDAAVKGGLYGGLQPVNNAQQSPDGSNSFFQEKGKQIAVGATTSAVAVPVGSAVARVISPNTSEPVNKLMQAGVTPTPGQILGGAWARNEEKMSSWPIIGDMIKKGQRRAVDDLNVAAYNRALGPIGEKSSGVIGREGVEEVKTKLGKAYDDLLPNLQFKADKQFSTELANLTGMVQNGNVPPEISKQFNSIIKNEVVSRMTPQGSMDGKAFKELESQLGQKIKSFKSSPNPNDQALGDALSEALASARDALSRANPAYAGQLAKINEGYANYARVRGAAAASGADSGVFTAAQLQSAVRSADKSVGKGKFATGNALMQDLSESGKTVLGSKYPDSGTAGRLAIPVATSGGTALAVTNPLMALGAAGLGGLAMAPYTTLGQRLAAAALAKRPAAAGAVANGVRALSPVAGAAVSPLLLSVIPQGSN